MTVRDPKVRVQLRIGKPAAVALFEWGGLLLMMVGVVCLTLFGWYQFEAHYFQDSLSRAFDHEREQTQTRKSSIAGRPRTDTQDATADHQPKAVADGASEFAKEVLGRLEIPSVGLNVMVLRGAENSKLRRGAGWLPSSAEPGQGNVAIAAHRDTHFRPLRGIHEGDLIELTTLAGRYDYRVEWTAVVDPDDTEVLAPTKGSAVTLITCYPFYYVGHAPQRFVVRAVPAGTELSSARPH